MLIAAGAAPNVPPGGGAAGPALLPEPGGGRGPGPGSGLGERLGPAGAPAGAVRSAASLLAVCETITPAPGQSCGQPHAIAQKTKAEKKAGRVRERVFPPNESVAW